MFLKNFWKNWTRKLNRVSCLFFCFFIAFYKAFLSGNLMMGGFCRFYPSCSEYAFLVYKNYSFYKATQFFLKRLFSCHPWGPKVREEPEIRKFIDHA